VQNVLDAWAALQVDVTDYNADDRAIMQRLGVIGPPTILFFGADGQERRAYRVVGEMNADEFTAHLEKAVPQ
jgi:thiol:disulfide interchange protein DsbD